MTGVGNGAGGRLASRLVKIPLDDHRTIIAELSATADAEPTDGLSPIARPAQWVTEAAQGTIESALRSTVVPLADMVHRELQVLREPPGEITLELGLTFDSRVGLSIAGIRLESSILVRLHWAGAATRD